MLKCDKENRECLDDVMSNCDHEIDRVIAERLKDGKTYAGYPAWNFYGTVWYEDNKYHCQIMRYHCHVDTISSESLEEIIQTASDTYGWD